MDFASRGTSGIGRIDGTKLTSLQVLSGKNWETEDPKRERESKLITWNLPQCKIGSWALEKGLATRQSVDRPQWHLPGFCFHCQVIQDRLLYLPQF
jgi:hypothetical protein